MGRGQRRGKGDGSIFEEPERNRWVGVVDLGKDGTGRRRRVKVTGPSRAEVARRLKQRRAELEAGATAPATMTVADLIAEWSTSVIPTLSPATGEAMRWAADLLTAGLGGHRVNALRATHVERFLRSAAAGTVPRPAGWTRDPGPLSRASVSRLRSVLGRILRWGQRRDLVAKDVAALAELPAGDKAREGRALTAVELRRLLAAAEGTRLAAVWAVLGGLGLRPGEALGLSWADVDLDGAILHVRSTLKWHAGTPTLGPLKTVRSRRSLAMPGPVSDALRAHRLRQVEERLAVGDRWPAEWAQLVFVTDAGTPIDKANLRRDLRAVAAAAGIEGHLRPYDLRHSCASLMAAAGVPLEHVADVLGHDGLRMARLVYTHALSPTIGAAAAPMGTALSGS